MKKIMFAVSALVILAACNSKKRNDGSLVGLDTSHLYNSSLATDTGAGNSVVINGVTYVQQADPAITTPATTKTTVTTTTTTTSNGTKPSNTSASNSSSPATTTSSSGTTTTTKKKGWSSAAKGTVIGAGTGALAGILVSKKKGKGAIIGGIIGAGAGYVIGRNKDKKSGRAN